MTPLTMQLVDLHFLLLRFRTWISDLRHCYLVANVYCRSNDCRSRFLWSDERGDDHHCWRGAFGEKTSSVHSYSSLVLIEADIVQVYMGIMIGGRNFPSSQLVSRTDSADIYYSW